MGERQKVEVAPTLLGKMARQCVDDSKEWYGDSACAYSISHHALSMSGEVGDFVNIVKRIERGDLNARDAKVRMAMANELTDIFVEVLNIAGLLNIDLEKSYQMVRANNQQMHTVERKNREAAKQNGG